MDELPDVALHLYPLDRLRQSELSVEAGRGCPYKCTFCSTAAFFQRRYRLKSNHRMIEEMERARARYNIDVFNLNHDLFGLNKRQLLEFCDLVRGRGFRWKCSMRTDTLDTNLVGSLAATGCYHLYFGVETGSPDLQKTIEKRLNLDMTRRIVRRVVEVGISCTTSFITGFPEETESDQNQTLDLIGELLEMDPWRVRPQLHVLSPEPGSPLSEGRSRIRFDGMGPEPDELVDDELVRAHPEVFTVFYHYDSKVPRWRSLFATAFITYLIPELGYPLTVFLNRRFFAARLSQMFAKLLPEATEISGFDSLIGALRASVQRFVTTEAGCFPYLPDLIRFSRIISEFERAKTDLKREHEDDNLKQRMWLFRCDSDILSMVRVILADPSADHEPLTPRSSETWYLTYLDDERQTMIAPVAAEAGRKLVELSELRDMPELYCELGVTTVEA
jgi:hypothetical protein